MNTILHPHTDNMIESVVKRRPHAILLHGKSGIGLTTTARYIAHRLQSAPLVLADSEGKSISVQTIRTLYRKTSTKKSSLQTIIIDNADTLSPGAQNALLKLLEEPTDNVLFILLAHRLENVLPTIHSRTWHINVLPLTKEQTISLVEERKVNDKTTQKQLLYMAQGLPAEINNLLEDNEHFKARASQIRTAREFLSYSMYDKLLVIYRLGSDREKALHLIDDMTHIVYLTLQTKPKQELLSTLAMLLEIKEKLLQDGNVRIQLLKAVI